MEEKNKHKDFTHAHSSPYEEEQELQRYKFFIEHCTSKAKSIKNYTDFKRINECIEALGINGYKTIFDFCTPYSLEEGIKLLNNLPLYIEYNKKGNNQYSNTVLTYQQYLYALELSLEYFNGKNSSSFTSSQPLPPLDQPQQQIYRPYLTAIKSKPFLLLAGISGTGKSRIVRELAFMSCPKYLQDKDGVTPGNYCMIEVKPNWHDSTELLGYYSNISREYQFKKFVKFLVKANMHPEVPFFVCLDEMNLAPVEQYFAEILSILETRKHPKTDEGVDMKTIKTEVLVEPQHFKYHSYKDESGAMREKLDMTDKDWYETFCGAAMMTEEERELINRYQYSRTLQQEGLSLPDNVINSEYGRDYAPVLTQGDRPRHDDRDEWWTIGRHVWWQRKT